MSRIKSALLGVVAVALLVSGCKFDGAYDLPLPGSPVDADEAYEVTVDFEDILNVVPRSPVMVDDVTVGEVTEVERVGWHARVTLRVREDVVLPDNAIAEIRQVSLLGEKYVALEAPADKPSDGRLGQGDTIPLSRTGRNPEVEEVLGALSFLLSGGGVGQLGTITAELNKAMDGRTNNLKALLGNLDQFVGSLDAQKADIISALESLNTLTGTLNKEREVITGALDVTGPAIKVLADQTNELVGTLKALDKLGVVGTRVIGKSKEDLLKILANLRPVLSKLRAAGDELAPGLNLLLSFPFPKEASEIVLGDYANTSIRADISLENFLPGPILELLDLPIPELPITAVNQIANCLASGNISSKACRPVVTDLAKLGGLLAQCKKAVNSGTTLCGRARALSKVLSQGGDDNKGGLLPNLPELPGLPGLNGLTQGLASGVPSPDRSLASLAGGGQ